MRILSLIVIILIFSLQASNAAICPRSLHISIEMDADWYKKEEERKKMEDDLIKKYSSFISKEEKPLGVEKSTCDKGEDCDFIKNCQMQRNVRKIRDVEYSIKTNSGITIKKSYCSSIGKCIGYNDFFHNSKVTASEDRLIDIKKNHAIFYHYFYSANSNGYEPPFNMTSFNSGNEIYFDDMPHFSPDENIILEVRSNEKEDVEGTKIPVGYNINIYQLDENGEYKNVEPIEFDRNDHNVVVSTFLSRHPECGEKPRFHSWKSNTEAILTASPSEKSEQNKVILLFFDPILKKWRCKDDILSKMSCKSNLPPSTKFSSNITKKQVENCQ